MHSREQCLIEEEKNQSSVLTHCAVQRLRHNWLKSRPSHRVKAAFGTSLKAEEPADTRRNQNIARIANAVQVTICLLVSTSVY